MSVDANVKRSKYPDEKWTVGVNWAKSLLPGETVIDSDAIAVGVELDGDVQLVGAVSKVRIKGGRTDTFDLSARVEFSAELSSGDVIGFNLGTPTRPR